ncbi:uncharacterized protein LOC133034126 [Cannabis sativa]|uniref:uncharacterized protein LOC133034126 n=1 Tax=Cannabis sativa TaxID=3483 RepID=UPI0029CA6561|nr:uncharacterized protein LOC133034126 [Cannabis sativa]
MAQGSGLLPSGTVQGALGFYTLFRIDFIPINIIPLSSSLTWCSGFCYFAKKLSTEKDFFLLMANQEHSSIDDLVEETENFSLDDFAIKVVPDSATAQETAARTVVGRFVAKRCVPIGTLRRALSGMWRVSPGWRLQEPTPRTFICRLNSPKEAKFVLEHGPWNPCGGFLLVAALPEDGDWKSADLSSLDIWVKASGVPMPFMTEECVANMAKRMGSLLQANKVSLPLLAGVSLTDERKKRWWCHFKYERLPLFCFKCGVIGHEEEACSGRKRTVTVHDGRTIPLYGPWLREGSKLENGFALLEVDDIHDINRLEKEDPVGVGVGGGSASDVGTNVNPPEVANVSVGTTRVEREGMEGVVSQKSDQAFAVAYNDYVDVSKFPTPHVMHVANIFKEKLGSVRFGADREDGRVLAKLGGAHALSKPKLVGPKGVPRPPVFGRSFDKLSGSKRKHGTGKTTRKNEFVGESQGQTCILVVDKTGVPNVFGAASGVNQSENSVGGEEGEDSSKRHRIDMSTLRSIEGSFGSGNRGPEPLLVGDKIVVTDERRGRVTESAPARLVVSGGETESLMSDARIIEKEMSTNAGIGPLVRDFSLAEEAGLIMPPKSP